MADDTVKTLNPFAQSRRALLRISLLVEGGMLVVALVLGLLAGVPVWEGASVGWGSISLGVAAGLALLAVVAPLTESNFPFAVQMRRDIERLLILFRGATLTDFLVISVLAGLGEEALFRGLLQTGLAGFLGVPLAITLTAIAFGFAHFISSAYVVFAAVLGVFFGILQAWSGNIVVPMIAHATYDFVALCFVYRGRVPGGTM